MQAARLDLALHLRAGSLDVLLLDTLGRLLVNLHANLLLVVLGLLLGPLLGLLSAHLGRSLLGPLGRGVDVNKGSRRSGRGTVGLHELLLDYVPDAIGRVRIAVTGQFGKVTFLDLRWSASAC